MIIHAISILFASFLVLGCSELTSDPGPTPVNRLNGITWELTNYSEQNSDPVEAQPNFTLQFLLFDQLNVLSGFDGCNTFSSEQLMVEDQMIVVLDGISMGDQSCEELQFSEYLMQLDFFYSVLSSPFNYSFAQRNENEILRIISASGNILEFVQTSTNMG